MKTQQTFSARGLFAGLLVAGLAAGCSSVKLDSDVPVESRTATPAGSVGAGGAGGANAGGANAGGASQSRVTPVDLAAKDAASANGINQRVVYFDFDSYVVKDEYRPTVEAHAKALAADRKKHLAIEGHTDERGGREYNLALGQKRAEAVAKSMTLLGATDAQVEAVSFGKERPAAQGSDEAAWAKNRRAELNYR
ncbi:MAG: peptidoglycan-associated lipoprotein Pal [Bacteriovorax sp.]|nr:peptidoglycan-associated lipoprotein Pal [Rhizobacter sp.]